MSPKVGPAAKPIPVKPKLRKRSTINRNICVDETSLGIAQTSSGNHRRASIDETPIAGGVIGMSHGAQLRQELWEELSWMRYVFFLSGAHLHGRHVRKRFALWTLLAYVVSEGLGAVYLRTPRRGHSRGHHTVVKQYW